MGGVVCIGTYGKIWQYERDFWAWSFTCWIMHLTIDD